MLYFWKLISKMKFNSPELNCSIFFPLYRLIVSKKTDYSLRDFVRIERLFRWINVNPFSFMHRYGSWCVNRFSLFWLPCDLPAITLTLVCDVCATCGSAGISVLLWSRVDHVFDCSIRYSDPGLRMVIIQRQDSDFNSMCQRPNTPGMLCIALLGQHQLSRIVQCFQRLWSRPSMLCLKRLNARCCWRSLWSSCRWRWFSIFWIKFRTLTLCDRFTVEFGTPGMLKSMFSSSVARLNSLSALDDAMSRCSAGTNCSFTVCVLALDFTGSPVSSWPCLTRLSSHFTGFPVLTEEPRVLVTTV